MNDLERQSERWLLSHYEERLNSARRARAQRRTLRHAAAALAAVTAVIYFLIGFNVISVIDDAPAQVFGLYAGAAYALGALLLVGFDRRLLWVLGAALQIFVILTYFNVADQRTPSYEFWGIALRVVQFVLLLALAYLSLRPAPAHAQYTP